tara:strand:+ start:3344 stop:4363 length:1020 start_codon:yes stop_codon:yes gene_type:complete
MSEFVLPNKKNVTFSKQTSTSESGSGGDFSFSSTPPERFDDGTIGDAITLESILEGIDIRYVASTAGYSHGATVNSWTNSGGLSNYNLSNVSSDTAVHPTFNIGGTNNPFTTGAMRFVLDTDGATSQHLHWGSKADGSGGSINTSTLTTDGAFSMYMVVSKDNEDGGGTRRMSSPLWVRGTTTGQVELQSIAAITTNRSTDLFVQLRGGAYTLGADDNIHRGAGDSDMTINNGDAIVLVITVDSSGNLSCFDFNAKNFINESKSIGRFTSPQSKATFVANSFGGPTVKPNGLAPFEQSPNGFVDGDAIYIAEFGFFSKKLEGQQAAALGRLLKEKYQIS